MTWTLKNPGKRRAIYHDIDPQLPVSDQIRDTTSVLIHDSGVTTLRLSNRQSAHSAIEQALALGSHTVILPIRHPGVTLAAQHWPHLKRTNPHRVTLSRTPTDQSVPMADVLRPPHKDRLSGHDQVLHEAALTHLPDLAPQIRSLLNHQRRYAMTPIGRARRAIWGSHTSMQPELQQLHAAAQALQEQRPRATAQAMQALLNATEWPDSAQPGWHSPPSYGPINKIIRTLCHATRARLTLPQRPQI